MYSLTISWGKKEQQKSINPPKGPMMPGRLGYCLWVHPPHTQLPENIKLELLFNVASSDGFLGMVET